MIVILLSFLSSLAGYVIAPIEVRYLGTLTQNTILIGSTYAVGSVLFSLISIWLGRLSDRLGRNKFVVFGMGLGIVYPLLYSFVFNIYQYMGVKAAWAFSAVTTGPVFMAYIQDLLKDDDNKAQFMGIVYAVQSIAGALSMFVGGRLSDLYGLKAPFYIMSALFAVSTIVSFFSLGINSPVVKRFKKRHFLFGVKYLFARPQLRFYFAINTVNSLNYGIKYMLYPLIIFSITNSNTVTGSVMATQGIVAFFVLIISGRIQKKFGLYKLAFLTLAILALSGNVLGLTQNIWIFWIFIGIYAIGEALYGPIQAVLLIDNVESEVRGEILGLDSTFDTILNTLGPFFAGVMLKFISPQKVLLSYTLLFWVVLMIGNLIYKKQIDTSS